MWNDQLDIKPLKMRRTRSFETSGTNYSPTQLNASEEQTSTGLQQKTQNKQATNQSTKPLANQTTARSTNRRISSFGQTTIRANELPISPCNSNFLLFTETYKHLWELLTFAILCSIKLPHLVSRPIFARHMHSGVFSNC
jgi:hypothetical protein